MPFSCTNALKRVYCFYVYLKVGGFAMKADRYRFDGTSPCNLRALPCDGKRDDLDKEEILAKTARNLQEMAA